MQPLCLQPVYICLRRLWKWYATTLGNPLSYPKQYATTLGNRLWKRCVTACLVTYPVMQPLMETVLALPKSLEPQHRQVRV
jgi:hypothetical protein